MKKKKNHNGKLLNDNENSTWKELWDVGKCESLSFFNP